MKLASVEKILDLKPIPGADFIEVATVLGWQIVVKKGEFKIGDLCAYIQIDTIVPEKPEFEFLRDRDFRVRTIKLRKQISQGLVLPLPPGKFKEGDDLTEILGVKKYEKPDNSQALYEPQKKPKTWLGIVINKFKYLVLYKLFPQLKRKMRSNFPKHLVSITDEERIQNIPDVLQAYQGKEFVVSYKLNGSSITVIHEKFLFRSHYRICSRNYELHDKNNEYYNIFSSTNLAYEIQKLVKHFKTKNIIIQGEALGDKFNGNYHHLKTPEIAIFNIYVDGKRISQDRLIEVCTQLKIPHCPLHSRVILNHTLPEVLRYSEIPDILDPNMPVEGLVWRCITDNRSFKVLNNQYLLKMGE